LSSWSAEAAAIAGEDGAAGRLSAWGFASREPLHPTTGYLGGWWLWN